MYPEQVTKDAYDLFIEIDLETHSWNLRKHSYRKIVEILNDRHGVNLNAMTISRWVHRFNWDDCLKQRFKEIYLGSTQ